MKNALPAKAIKHPNADQLRDALRFWATGVTIVAAQHGGVVHGMTVNTFTSLSVATPLVSISLEKITRTHQLVSAAGAFAVTILNEDQGELSDRFAGRDTEHSNRFENLDTFTLDTGSPILSLGLAYFDCRVVSQHDAGTHTVFISEVLACGNFGASESGSPLVYFNRGYRKLR